MHNVEPYRVITEKQYSEKYSTCLQNETRTTDIHSRPVFAGEACLVGTTPSHSLLVELKRLECGTCESCRQDDCGRCASCRANKFSTTRFQQVCLLGMGTWLFHLAPILRLQTLYIFTTDMLADTCPQKNAFSLQSH
jgi:CXXC zinc finger domain